MESEGDEDQLSLSCIKSPGKSEIPLYWLIKCNSSSVFVPFKQASTSYYLALQIFLLQGQKE